MPEAPDALIVLTTASDEESARRIATRLVEDRLAACVNIVPRIRSVYRWEGKVTEDDETMLLIKTRAPRFEKLRETIREVHPYDLPEVIALPVDRGDGEFLGWIRSSTEESAL